MTCDEFEMDPHSCLYRRNEIEWDIKARDGGIRIEFSVYDENIQEVVKDNFEYFMDTVAKEIADRVLSLWDEGKITDREKQNFIDVFRKVIG